ncbi:MAG: response regulator transcription factor [Bacteroidota bacterium]
MNQPIRIIIADDQDIINEGLKTILENEASIQIKAIAKDGLEVIKLLNKYPNEIDVAVLDIEMPNMNGIETAKHIAEKFPHVKVLFLSNYDELEFVKKVLEAGGSGYLLKNTGRQRLVNAIHKVAKGEEEFDQKIVEKIMHIARNPQKDEIKISKREREILHEIGLGKTSAEISESLHISVHTVDTHRRNLLSKLNLNNSYQLVRYAIEHNI